MTERFCKCGHEESYHDPTCFNIEPYSVWDTDSDEYCDCKGFVNDPDRHQPKVLD